MSKYFTFECVQCGDSVVDRPNVLGRYCSKKCSDAFRHEQWIRDWLVGTLDMERTYNGPYNQVSTHIRRYLREECGGDKCSKCGWAEINLKTGLVPVQVNHIDGDSTNNRRGNLEVLCPNCHSLTPTFGRHGKGRKKRYAGVA